MTDSDDADRALLTGAYALNALTPAQSRDFERFLARSESARAEATELADTAVLLGLAAAPVRPSADLKSRLLAEVARTPQAPALPQAVEQLPDVRLAERQHVAHRGRPAVARRRRGFTPRTVVGIVAVAAALVVGGFAIDQAFVAPTTSQQAAGLTRIVTASDVQTSTEKVGAASMTLYNSDSLGQAAVTWKGLGSAGSGKTYQLWIIDDGATSAGVFNAGSGSDNYRILDGKLPKGATVGITVEPAGGSSQPTTAPIAEFTAA